MNTAATFLGTSPPKYVSPKGKVRYVKNKAKKMSLASQEKLCNLMDVPSMEIDPEERPCTKCKDFDEFVTLLVEKCKVST